MAKGDGKISSQPYIYEIRLSEYARDCFISGGESAFMTIRWQSKDSGHFSLRRSFLAVPINSAKIGANLQQAISPQKNWVQACKKGGKEEQEQCLFKSEPARKRFSAPLNTGIRILYFRDKKEETAVNPEAENAQKFYFRASF